MCGIAGIFSKYPVEGRVMEVMTHALKHRGPDAHATFLSDDKKLALGHARLSIIDLSTAANQPMHSADGNLTIVFNGEIYNYKEVRTALIKTNDQVHFHTNSDTETILHAFAQWGPKMVEKLNGMFTIAIYDHRTKSLYLFRDRIGKKPLYVFESGNDFVFASEIKSLLLHPRVQTTKSINVSALQQVLHLGYIPGPGTAFKGIQKFPAGHWALKKLDLSLELHKYWQPEDCWIKSPISPLSPSELSIQLGTLLEASVKRRLISDVPIGSFLSGGTDSSLVTALAAKHHEGKLKTFSIGFQETKYNESFYALEVAKHLGTDHHAFELTEADALPILETYLNHFDEPFADTSAIPTMLVSQLTKPHVSVALTGDGGDELFLGYGSYDWAQRLANPFWQFMQTPTRLLFNYFGTDRLKRIASMLEKVRPQQRLSHIFSQEQYFFSESESKKMLLNPIPTEPLGLHEITKKRTPAERQALFDIHYYLKDDLLVKVDMASMYHSLECRCPLLDYEVVEFALQIPENFKSREGVRKRILKELLSQFLPQDLVHRPKWGFSVPLPLWLKGKLSYLIDDYLSSPVVNRFGLVKANEVEALVKRFRSGEDRLYNRVWVLIVLHKWLERNA